MEREHHMEYKVYNKRTKTFENDSCIVTQKGEVGFLDPDAGREEGENSNNYIIIFQEGQFTMSNDELKDIILAEYHESPLSYKEDKNERQD